MIILRRLGLISTVILKCGSSMKRELDQGSHKGEGVLKGIHSKRPLVPRLSQTVEEIANTELSVERVEKQVDD